MKDYTYLIKALRSYREVSYGQFDKETEYKVEETQDAATAILELLEKVEELENKITALENKLNQEWQKMLYAIYSEKESENQGEPMFWNNETGWGEYESTTLFTNEDRDGINLPVAGKWIKYTEAQKILQSAWHSLINML